MTPHPDNLERHREERWLEQRREVLQHRCNEIPALLFEIRKAEARIAKLKGDSDARTN